MIGHLARLITRSRRSLFLLAFQASSRLITTLIGALLLGLPAVVPVTAQRWIEVLVANAVNSSAEIESKSHDAYVLPIAGVAAATLIDRPRFPSSRNFDRDMHQDCAHLAL